MGLAEESTRGFQHGQSVKREKTDQERNAMRLQLEQEDRKHQKDVLAHQFKSLKIAEQKEARDAAFENLKAMEGTDVNDLAPGQIDMSQFNMNPQEAAQFTLPGNFQAENSQMASMQIPGVEELNIPGIQKRPQTMQEVLANEIATTRALENEKIREISAGASVARGPNITATAPGRTKMVWARERDAAGTETRHYVTEEEAASRGWDIEPMPSSGVLTTDESVEEVGKSIIRGDTPASKLREYKGGDNLKLTEWMAKRGFSLTRALQMERAVNKTIDTLNSAEQIRLQQLSAGANYALDDLEAANTAWDKGRWGNFSWVNLKAAQSGALGDEAKDQADAVVEAIAATQEALDSVEVVGSQPTVQTTKDASVLLDQTGKEDLTKAIARMSTAISYRTRAINNYQPTVPGVAPPAPKKAPTDADVAKALKDKGRAYDPATVAKVKADPEIMKFLFP